MSLEEPIKASSDSDATTSTTGPKRTYTGGCHCGNIRYRATLDINPPNVTKCNCSICRKNGYIFAPRASRSEFELLSPPSITDATVGAYEFGSKVICHHFCKICGVSCFFKLDVKNGDENVSYGVNSLTLDPDQVDLKKIKFRYWNGLDEDWSGTKDEPGPNGIW